MGPDETCSKLRPSETARRWPVEEKSQNHFKENTFASLNPNNIPLILFSWFEQSLLQAPASGFLASQITTSQWTKACRKTDVWQFLRRGKKKDQKHQVIFAEIYLATQVIFVFSKGEHQDLKTFEVRRMLNSFISPNRMEDHPVRVHWVYTTRR